MLLGSLLTQGMGNLVNACVVIICLAIFGQTGKHLDPIGSRNVIIVQFAMGAAVALFMAVWRFTRLKESKVKTPQAPGWLPTNHLAGRACPVGTCHLAYFFCTCRRATWHVAGKPHCTEPFARFWHCLYIASTPCM